MTSAVARVQQQSVRRLATATGENEFVAERLHHKEHAGSKYTWMNGKGLRRCRRGG